MGHITSREQLQNMSSSAIMDLYRSGNLDALLMHGQGGMLDEATGKAVALVNSMEQAFGDPVQRGTRKKHIAWGGQLVRTTFDGETTVVADLADKVNAVKQALR